MQHEKTDKLDCSGVYRIQCASWEQKYIGGTGRKIGLQFKEQQRLGKTMDTQRSEIAEDIALTGPEIDTKAGCTLLNYAKTQDPRSHRYTTFRI
ncbi:unnamed protein product [Protopolystoma xenopodis]|uniref:Uncharacterized protein n=1 Tax=Protopolystoma xenopodis TaxID=117903 RepID=A0A3S5C4L9_9PLAT|nr:unnamed protein product [Protopolystoma xenopodis]